MVQIVNFWSIGRKRVSASGASVNSSFSFGRTEQEKKADFMVNILPRLKSQSIIDGSCEKYIPIDGSSNRVFCDIVNDALEDVYNGCHAYLFTTEQVAEFVRHNPNVNVKLKNGTFLMESR